MSPTEIPLLTVKDFAFSYPQRLADMKWRIEIPNLELHRNHIYSLFGSNMSGKSTLLRILAGLENVRTVDRSCKFFLGGSLIDSSPVKKIDSFRSLPVRDLMLLAHSDQMFPSLTVWENVAVVGNRMLYGGASEARHRLLGFLEKCGLKEHKVSPSTFLQDLSSGAQAFIRLARSYCCNSKILLIDEVTGQLDDSNASIFFNVLNEVLPLDAAVVLVSHHQRDHQIASDLAQSRCSGYTKLIINESETNGERLSCVQLG
jgi:ABC-type multidrug transport system ATPase subunit